MAGRVHEQLHLVPAEVAARPTDDEARTLVILPPVELSWEHVPLQRLESLHLLVGEIVDLLDRVDVWLDGD